MIQLCSYGGLFIIYLDDKKQMEQWHAMELMTQIGGKQLQANADGYVDI